MTGDTYNSSSDEEEEEKEEMVEETRRKRQNKQNRVRGGTGDRIHFATDWPEKVGGCDDKVKEMLCRGGRCVCLCM